jgi:hypothetical protein
MWGNQAMDENQDGHLPLLVQRGGLWLDAGLMSWPFGKVTVFRDYFEVNGARFTTQNVIALKRMRGILSSGLRIVHSNRNTNKTIVFWSFDFPSLHAALAQIGFCVAEPSRHWRDNPGPLFLCGWLITVVIAFCLAQLSSQ